jgi:chemotaxis protein methyltransferase WspC
VNLSLLDGLVRTRLGIDPEALGTSVFPNAVGRRMAARGVADATAYAALVAAEPGEQAALLGDLVVPETWFFRGGRPLFDHLAAWVAARAAARGPVPVRILSLPCSTGEEPNSLAIALTERGVPPAAYRIDGVDLAPTHLARAAAGRYPAFAFREPGADPRLRHFRPTDDGRWELTPELRQAVRFRPGNAVDPMLLAGENPYDLILCRHLFIYLTAVARERVTAHLERLLAADGLLCVSPGEAARLAPDRFVALGPPAFCLFHGAAVPIAGFGAPRSDCDDSWEHASLAQTDAAGSVNSLVVRMATPADEPALAVSPRSTNSDPLAAARELADAGKLEAAIAAYEHAALTHTSADGFSLLGIIELARGRAEAAGRAFRKALYLEPDHPEALSHMILLCERRGESARADALRRRLARVEREESA